LIIGAEISTILFGVMAAVTWGTGDFSGSQATKRMHVASVQAISHPVGLVLLVILAFINGERGIAPADWFWAVAAGIAGGIGMALLYQALAVGRAGVVAPITSILATALPVIGGITTNGLPAPLILLGFGLALLSVLLVTTGGGVFGELRGVRIAVASGIMLGIFFMLLARTESEAVFLPLALARVASSIFMIGLALGTRSLVLPTNNRLLAAILIAGVCDVLGNMFFVLSERGGRLDIAAVLSSLYPAVTVLWASLIAREKVSTWQFVGIVIGLVAVALISNH
jgi:drug/metabolite transporter (DMT)-like permease